MFEAFREPDYRRFWLTQFISNIGSWMQGVAQGWLVYRLTDSPFLLGFVGFASSVPSILLMLPGGVLADQLDRRRTLRISQGVQALSALFIAVSVRMGHIGVWQIVGAALVSGTAIAFSAPAYQAMVVDLLDDRARLPNAVAMNSLQFNLSRAIGPVLAGLTLSMWGSFWCFFFNALSFLPLIWVLGRLKDRQQRVDSGAMMARMAEALRYVREHRTLLVLLAIVAAGSLFGFPYLNLMPVVARSLFRDDAAGLGWLTASIGAGALGASLALAVRTPPLERMRRLIVGSLLLFGVALACVGVTRSVPVVVALLVVCGASMVMSLALCNNSIQQRVPDDMRGRILSMYTFSFFSFLPFGNLMAGTLAEHRGVGVTLAVLGGGLVVAGVAAALAE